MALARRSAPGATEGDVDEHVLAAFLQRDEANALGGVADLHSAESHAPPAGTICPG
jgi:hypothetical protein